MQNQKQARMQLSDNRQLARQKAIRTRQQILLGSFLMAEFERDKNIRDYVHSKLPSYLERLPGSENTQSRNRNFLKDYLPSN